MSTRHYSWAWRQPVTGLARYVLLALVERANTKGECWPSVATLASMTGLAEKTVRRHLHELEAAGAIERHRRSRKNGNRTSDRIVLVCVDDSAIGLAVTATASQPVDSLPVTATARPRLPVTLTASERETSGHSDPDYRSERPRKIPPEDPSTTTEPNTGDQDLVLDVEKRSDLRAGHSARIIADLQQRRRRHTGAERADQEPA